MLETFYREIAGHECYGMMAEHAEAFLKSHGLSQSWDVDTRFQGTRSNPEITGSIRGITSDNFTPGALTVGVMRGIITELHGMYEAMRKLAGRNAGIIVGLEVRVPEGKEEAARGCALCAADIV